MTKFATFAAALGLTATSALAGGYVAPVVDVEPVVVEERPASTNAGLVVPALLLLGFVLGPLIETNLRRTMLISRGDPMVFLERPIACGFVIATALLILLSIWQAARRR